MSKFKYIIIGLVISLTIAVLVWGINYLKGKNFFVKEQEYYVVYNKIEGLTASNPVTINGLRVGQVRDIYFHPDKTGRVIVKFVLTQDYQIPDSTIAMIYSIDLMGSKGISLNLTHSKKYYNVGDTLFAATEKDLKEQVSAQMLPLKRKAEELMFSMDSVMSVIQYIFNKQTRDNLSKTFESIKMTVRNLESTSVSLDTLMRNEKGKLAIIFDNIESITTNLKNNNEKLTTILTNFSDISDTLAKANIYQTIINANKALADASDILAKIQRGEGSMGLLINDDSLYNNLNRSADNLDKLLYDINQNPKKYVHFSLFDFGKTYNVDENGKKHRVKKKKDTSSLGIKFRIQIKSSKKPIKDYKKLFAKYDVKEIFIDGRYKYFVGEITDFYSVKFYQRDVRKYYNDAFAVAFKNDTVIPYSKAVKEINSSNI